MNIIGIDIGGTNFRIGLVDENNNVLSFKKVPTSAVIKSTSVLEDISEYVEDFLKDTPFDALAIGFPATLGRERKKVLQAPNLRFMENLNVTDYLSKRLNVPVYAERDVTMAIYFDMAKYNIAASSITCAVYYGTGVGNAICINETPLVGKNGTAGELGHIPVIGDTTPCGCGNIGCIESLAGGKALRSILERFFPETPISDVFTHHGNSAQIQQFLNNMSIAAASEVNILDPDHLLIGGGVTNMTDFPKDRLKELIIKHSRKPYPAENLNIVFTEDEPAKSVIGAAIYARTRI
ncbi:allose kinase [Butyrivibrio sp. LC3010]|uniref:allose kinase n=1 Tax=Butyrivibrio sp. LC3010 TaxID=1280680 RepID=UPI000416773C|nr:allose kinase [Butyrivibrio sp. LC3010]